MSDLGDRLKKKFLKNAGIETQAAGNYNPEVEKFSNGINIGTDIGVNRGTEVFLPKGNWQVNESYGNAQGEGYIGNFQNRGYGNSVLVTDLDTNESFRFSHLLKSLVTAGQRLTGGLIGLSGNTGNTTGPHLDIETYKNGALSYLNNISSNVSGKINLQNIYDKAREKYGNNILAVTTSLEKANAYAKKVNGKTERVEL